eukprot:PITA_36679
MTNERMDKLERMLQSIQFQLDNILILAPDAVQKGKEVAHEEENIGNGHREGESSHSPHLWGSPKQQSRPRPPKLDMHKFHGSHPTSWIAQMEQYFNLNNILDDATQIMVGSMYLDNERWQWWEWHQLDENITAFEALAFRTWGLSDVFYTECFISGLKEAIKAHVQLHHPPTWLEACKVARDVERALAALATRPNFTAKGRTTQAHSTTQTLKGQKVSPVEMAKRRKQGLCYYCDEKYSLGHKCKEPKFFQIDATGYSSSEEDTPLEKPKAVEEDNQKDNVPDELVISLHALAGISSPQTLKIRGRRENVKLQMGDYQMKTHMFAIHMGGCEIVLGAEWLRTLGPITMDFQELYMSFKQNNSTHTLRGLQAGAPSIISLHKMEKLLKKGHHGVIAQFNAIQGVETKSLPIHLEMQQILNNHLLIFDKPHDLPPSRGEHDHSITLVPGAQPPNVRPYRYPFTQKNEIEKIIKELLEVGVIRPSISPYSSPVVMVLKKDGEWQMCPDFRALNKLTVKDKFPIPVVDDFLDELNGAQFFTKLDLCLGYHQICMKEVDIPKTAFRTHEGHYEFLVMPFGLCNAPSTFQSLMNHLLKPYLRKFVLVFFDDILIYSCTWAAHLQHVDLLLQLLRKHQLFVNMSKCLFGMEEVEYLGHIVGCASVKVDPKKIQAMQDWP